MILGGLAFLRRRCETRSWFSSGLQDLSLALHFSIRGVCVCVCVFVFVLVLFVMVELLSRVASYLLLDSCLCQCGQNSFSLQTWGFLCVGVWVSYSFFDGKKNERCWFTSWNGNWWSVLPVLRKTNLLWRAKGSLLGCRTSKLVLWWLDIFFLGKSHAHSCIWRWKIRIRIHYRIARFSCCKDHADKGYCHLAFIGWLQVRWFMFLNWLEILGCSLFWLTLMTRHFSHNVFC